MFCSIVRTKLLRTKAPPAFFPTLYRPLKNMEKIRERWNRSASCTYNKVADRISAPMGFAYFNGEKMESERPQVIVEQMMKIDTTYYSNRKKFGPSPPIIYIPLDQYEVRHLINFLDLDIRDTLTKAELEKLMSNGVNIIVK